MCDRAQIGLNINGEDQELQTMDLLVQIMGRMEINHESLALEGDVDVVVNRIASWFGNKYNRD